MHKRDYIVRFQVDVTVKLAVSFMPGNHFQDEFVAVELDGKAVDWMQKVTDEQYRI